MVIGAPTPARELDGLTGRKGVLSIDGAVYEQGLSDDVGCDPMELVAWLGGHLARRGQPLRPGQWIITGSFVSTTFPAAGACAMACSAAARMSAGSGAGDVGDVGKLVEAACGADAAGLGNAVRNGAAAGAGAANACLEKAAAAASKRDRSE